MRVDLPTLRAAVGKEGVDVGFLLSTAPRDLAVT